MGYSDIGCYGGEVETPNLDRLAANGLRFSQFYNTARCSPSRASLLTGLHPHQTGIGILTYDSGPEGYAGNLNQRCVTIAEVLKASGYRSYLSGKWHVAEQPDAAHRQLAAAARLRRVLRHHHRRRQLLRPEHADARQREHRARGAGDRASSTPTPSATRRSTFIRQHRARARRHAVLPVRRLHRAALAAARARRGHRQVQGPLRQGLGHAARGAAASGWSQSGILDSAVAADRARPDAAGVDARPSTRRGCCAAWRCMPRRSTAWTRASAASSRALEKTGQLDNTLVIFLADNGACAEDIPENVTDRRAGEQADDRARSHTRDGEPVHFGNNPQRHARPGEHLPELRHGLGEPVEHAVPPVQALDPRGRHLDAADRALAGGHRATAARSATRRAICPTSWRPSSTSPARPIPRHWNGQPHRCRWKAQSLVPVLRRRRRRAAADVLGARRQRRGAHRQVEAGAQVSRAVGAVRHGGGPHRDCTTWRRSTRARRGHGARSTRPGRSAAA